LPPSGLALLFLGGLNIIIGFCEFELAEDARLLVLIEVDKRLP
jgi:hypothetical protein